MMNAASPYVWPQACMAIGVEVHEEVHDAVADRAGKYRDDELRLGGDLGEASPGRRLLRRRRRRDADEAQQDERNQDEDDEREIGAEKARAGEIDGEAARVRPRMPPTRPPARTSEMAMGLKSPLATSAAAKR